MLVRFIVSNFLSFKDETEFNMIADTFRNHKHHLYKAKTLKILKGSVIYGANGAGKSNLVKSVEYLQKLVKTGEISHSVNSKKFKLDASNLNKPVNFEIEFYYKRKVYNYGIQINGKVVENEWLYISGIDKNDKLIFERKTNKSGKSRIRFNKRLMATQKEKLLIELLEDKLLPANELLLGKVKTINNVDIINANEWITNQMVIVYPQSKFSGLIPFLQGSKGFKKFTNSLLPALKTGVNKLDIQNIPFDHFFRIDEENIKNELKQELENDTGIILTTGKGNVMAVNEKNNFIIKKIVTLHNNNNGEKISFNLQEESDGTRRLLDLIPAFYGILKEDITFIIDEIDRSIHPGLLYDLVKKIMDDNNTKGQLVFTTHDSNLLDLSVFRQDEIWFAKKNEEGATRLYSLSEFRPRYDLDIRKGYLKGRFGAVPSTSELKRFNLKKYAEEERI